MKTLVIGHRGCAGLEPENSLRAFRRAAQLGVDAVELDVHVSRDGVPVVIHDARLERTTNGRGRVCDWSARELSALVLRGRGAPAQGVPRLAQVLECVPAPVGLLIELKAAHSAAPVLSLLRTHRALKRATIISFDFGLLREVRSLEKGVALGTLWERPPADAMQAAKALGADLIDVNHRYATARLVERAHAAQLQCVVWTVNRTAEMRQMLRLGVDGITTDYPDRLVKLVRETCR
jgi:glycerophosphoryl diester phosphodiesterase